MSARVHVCLSIFVSFFLSLISSPFSFSYPLSHLPVTHPSYPLYLSLFLSIKEVDTSV